MASVPGLGASRASVSIRASGQRNGSVTTWSSVGEGSKPYTVRASEANQPAGTMMFSKSTSPSR
ncbi:hypothetical protein D3C72_2398930 [compost metagenome]